MPLDMVRARKLLADFDFKPLFIEELGWNRHESRLDIQVDGQTFALAAVAEKCGMVVFVCDPGDGARITDDQIRRKIERQVTKSAYEHLIVFLDAAKSQQYWLWSRRETGRQPVLRGEWYRRGETGERLAQKIRYLAVALEEEENLTLPDVTGRARKAFDVERFTKKFYDRFKTEHEAFIKFLEGIPDAEMERWYVSVMLNRLMFIYFIQKKGFLDGDPDYLKNKLTQSRRELGKDLFYRDFLCPLFFEGFAKQKNERSEKTQKLLGEVPYLNGGIFLPHQIEKLHGNTIAIPNKAFEKLFAFFDTYQWYLDERPLKADTEINPDVLGYIFEKYINQKQMGAYYTKEDITGYISQSTVIPFLFDAAREKCKVAFDSERPVWRLLAEDPDRYIYQAVKHGADKPLPQEIAEGLDAKQPNLFERRKDWNKAAPPECALPTEIWRQVVARRMRYEEIKSKLVAGELRSINDLITFNLDVRRFAQDVIENAEGPELLVAIWKAIEAVTVLDPTCGSGAFLFAALNVLDPLYEACLERMHFFLEEWGEGGKKNHPNYHKLFTETLKRGEGHRRYFVLKSIIVNNLFGVDIMEEAVEICKLRLFLKLVAQIERAEDIEPLPDIDFNIRAGNTLVGFTSLAEVKKTQEGTLGFAKSDVARIEEEAEIADRAFGKFREMQVQQGMSPKDFAEAKENLRARLRKLTDELDRFLAGEYDINELKILNKCKREETFEKWCKSHQPFHWFAEFYGILKAGGFDVIIGNPPYVEVPMQLNRRLLATSFRTALDRWSRDENLYTFVVERSLELLRPRSGQLGMILPLSLAFSTKKPFFILRQIVSSENGAWHWSHFDRIPSALFGNEVRTRCTIALLARNGVSPRGKSTTSLLRWNAEYRDILFKTLYYSRIDLDIAAGMPKVGSQIQADVLKTLTAANALLAPALTKAIPFPILAAAAPKFPQPCLYVGGTAYNWFPAWRDIPKTTNMDGRPSLPARTAGYRFPDEESANIVFALLCSSLGYWWWAVASDAFNLKKWLLERFPLSPSMIPGHARGHFAELGAALRTELRRNYVYKDNKGRIGNFLLPACNRQTTDIDAFLAVSIPGLSVEFFDDVRGFNEAFSRVEPEDEEAEAE